MTIRKTNKSLKRNDNGHTLAHLRDSMVGYEWWGDFGGINVDTDEIWAFTDAGEKQEGIKLGLGGSESEV